MSPRRIIPFAERFYLWAYRYTLGWIVLVGALAAFAYAQNRATDAHFNRFQHGLCVAIRGNATVSASNVKLLRDLTKRARERAALDARFNLDRQAQADHDAARLYTTFADQIEAGGKVDLSEMGC